MSEKADADDVPAVIDRLSFAGCSIERERTSLPSSKHYGEITTLAKPAAVSLRESLPARIAVATIWSDGSDFLRFRVSARLWRARFL